LIKKLLRLIGVDIPKFPAGHFHSPLIDKRKVLAEESLFDLSESFPGIEMNVDGQLQLLDRLKRFYLELNFPETEADGNRYHYQNPFFSYSDAIIYSCLIREYKPTRIIEIGSGFSTACALDTFSDLTQNCEILCVDPNPARLKSLLTESDKESVHIESKEVQKSSIKNALTKLVSGDILFVDSSHVSKTASDVNYIIHELLPLVGTGVLIHFHDVFHNFEYPETWIREGVELNEQYILRSFLQYNSDFDILLFSDYMEKHHKSWYEANMPKCLQLHERIGGGGNKYVKNITGQSIWLIRRQA